MDLSISYLSDITGHDRKTIARRLESLTPTEGAKGAKLYESGKALELIYGVRANRQSVDEAKREDYIQRAALSKARREVLDRTRIPIEIPLQATEQALQAIVNTLKFSVGKVLTVELVNAMLADFRAIPDELECWGKQSAN
jgi:hypothetical protein